MKAIAISVFVAALAVSGCANLKNAVEAAEKRQAARDDEKCQSYGFKKGTEGYAQCRMLADQQNQQRDAAYDAAWQANTQAYLQSLNRQQPAYIPHQRTTTTTSHSCRRYGSVIQCTSY